MNGECGVCSNQFTHNSSFAKCSVCNLCFYCDCVDIALSIWSQIGVESDCLTPDIPSDIPLCYISSGSGEEYETDPNELSGSEEGESDTDARPTPNPKQSRNTRPTTLLNCPITPIALPPQNEQTWTRVFSPKPEIDIIAKVNCRGYVRCVTCGEQHDKSIVSIVATIAKVNCRGYVRCVTCGEQHDKSIVSIVATIAKVNCRGYVRCVTCGEQHDKSIVSIVATIAKVNCRGYVRCDNSVAVPVCSVWFSQVNGVVELTVNGTIRGRHLVSSSSVVGERSQNKEKTRY
ncbi:hypothetical protein J6590_101897 [Homalodisca vitripennis]|nr:hypothetical protein J6590_101897 [Homalodisca vitripennis]